ncbi:hypothetical protein EH240_19775 [Mesorhizobium tamadayense]|uniref:Uncharacterized protein n=1 Tax=Mesorhizobium tamadayense TaxID=425306 RepID=A0A3P3FK14_9HYPH|nr:hypothetical protein [Mesorhizobium tamadayense]RRH98038.1 hypothetical protein EH240_19775 [Mesorhizobium tamadayense]
MAGAGASCAEGAGNEETQTGLMISRRSLIAGLVAATAIGKAESTPNLRQKIDETAANLAALMNELHGGGSWFANVDHDNQFVLVAPEP